MKKIIIFLGIIVSIYAGTIEQIKNNKEIRIGIKYNSKPFGFKENRIIKGFDIELSKMIVNELKKELNLPTLKVFYKKVIPANRETKLINNKVDMVIATYTITDKRKKKINFSIPYFEDPVIIISKTKKPQIIGVLKGSTTKNLMKKLGYKIKEYLDYPRMFKDFDNNKIEAISTNKSILYQYVNQNKYHIINTDDIENYGIGMRKDKKFTKLINNILMKLKSNGKLKALKEKWFGANK